jgi:hypothetical protein
MTMTERHTAPTAYAIAQVDALTDRTTMAGVGIALHHFTEPLDAPLGLEIHRATAVLSKQARSFIERPDGLELIAALVTDPHRIATPNGCTAAEVCGDEWDRVAAVAGDRAACAIEGAVIYGRDAVNKLAVIRAVNTRHAWWGTMAWAEKVEVWCEDHHLSRRLRTTLLTAPERVADDVLYDVLSR